MSDTVDKDGFLYKRAGSTKKSAATQKKWNAYYFNLVQGSLYYYKNAEDPEPKGKLQLLEIKFFKEDPTTELSGKKYTFGFKNDKVDLLLAAEDEQDWKEWVEAVEGNLSKGPAPPLKKEKRKSRAQEIAFKVKKNLGTKAAASKLGKKALRSQAPEEITNLVRALKHIVERDSKSPKRANEMEENMYKLGIKTFFLIDGGKITIEDLLVADKPLRVALELLAKCHDHAKYSRVPNQKLLLEKFEEVEKKLHEGADILGKLLEPHLKPKTMKMLQELVDYIGNSERLFKIFQDPSLDDDLQELISASEHYTQFHFYAEK